MLEEATKTTHYSIRIDWWDDQTGMWANLDEATSYDKAEEAVKELLGSDKRSGRVVRYRIVTTTSNEFTPLP